MATQSIDLTPGFKPKSIDLSAGFTPKKSLEHPAGQVTAFDEDTGLPIVRRHPVNHDNQQLTETQNETNQPEPAKDLGKDEESGRDILHQSTDREYLVQQAKEAAPQLESDLEEIAKSIPGVELEGVREQKDPERLTEKIEREGQPVHTIPDILAARLAVDSPEAKDAAVDAIKQKFDVIRDEDEFEKGSELTGYRAHKFQVQITPELSAEIHVVPKEISEVNDDQHEDYEKMREAALSAKETNDAAMDEFEKRNSSSLDVRQNTTSERKGDRGEAPEQEKAAPVSAAPSPLKVGDSVVLKDGRRATVAYAPPASAQLPTYRLKTEDGKNVEIRARDLEKQVKSAPKDGKYIAVDWDGTVVHYEGWKGPTVFGPPIKTMVDRIKRWLANGEDVCIFTARITDDNTGAARKAIEKKCQELFGQVLPITNIKSPNMVSFFDDRAVQVERNDGKILGSHRKAREES